MKSIALEMHQVEFPSFTGLQVYMKNAMSSVAHLCVPEAYRAMVRGMLDAAKVPADQQVWITIDESHVTEGNSHRRGRAHVDGCREHLSWGDGGWLNGVPGREVPDHIQKLSYENELGGMLIASNFQACKVWKGEYSGVPGLGGDCEHLRDQFGNLEESMMKDNTVYLTNSTCIHESMPLTKTFDRQLIRITLAETFQPH